MPSFSASSPATRRPVAKSSFAACAPITRGSTVVSPNPGVKPSFTKFAVNRDSGQPTRKSENIARPKPPPTAAPCTAATTYFLFSKSFTAAW